MLIVKVRMSRVSQVVLAIKCLPANAGDTETQAPSLGQEDPLVKGMDTHSSILAWRNVNNLRYEHDTILMAETEEELKSLLMKVKVESEKWA